jgi:PIN domain nuclease of toxin-antitoxin system
MRAPCELPSVRGLSATTLTCRPQPVTPSPIRPTSRWVSTASIWEVAIGRSLGRLSAPDDLPAQVLTGGFGWLAVSTEHAWEVRRLPMHHRDPFDRLLVAQALREQISLVTRNRHFGAYGVDTLW